MLKKNERKTSGSLVSNHGDYNSSLPQHLSSRLKFTSSSNFRISVSVMLTSFNSVNECITSLISIGKVKTCSGPKKLMPLLNDTHREKLCYNSVQEFIEIEPWLLLTFFICLHNQSSSTRDSSSRRLFLSASFTAKFELLLVLTQKNVFTRDFQYCPRLRDRHVFMWQSLEILNVFNTLTLK